jgi:hypothetical protein
MGERDRRLWIAQKLREQQQRRQEQERSGVSSNDLGGGRE